MLTTFSLCCFLLADEVVKVPQMAESISEGTLKSWLKKPGEAVEADEEVATIETDKVSPISHGISPSLTNSY